jgi:hypothetical protein
VLLSLALGLPTTFLGRFRCRALLRLGFFACPLLEM